MSKELTLDHVKEFAALIKEAGGRAFLCGGASRDKLLGLPSKDFDLECHEIDPKRLETLADIWAVSLGLKLDKVGQSFTVLKIGTNLDISIPRIEKKSGIGHKAFEIIGDPNLGTFEASRRRDFTINAIMQDILSEEITDHFGGQEDLKNKIIRVVDPKTFVEDSLRVLRAAQFAARFGFNIEEETLKLCQSIDLSDLPRERIWTEIEKLLLSRDPFFGLGCLNKLGVIDQLFPELQQVRDNRSLFGTSLTLRSARKVIDDLSHEKKITIMLTALCGDFRSTEAVESFLDRLNIQTINNFNVRETMLKLLEVFKTFTCDFEDTLAPTSMVRRLSTKVEIDLFARVLKSRSLEEEADWLVDEAIKLGVEHEAPQPVLMGRDLLLMGFQPSPQMGKILAEVFEKQLDGEITNLEEARRFVNATFSSHN